MVNKYEHPESNYFAVNQINMELTTTKIKIY